MSQGRVPTRKCNENPRFSASESQVAWDTGSNRPLWSGLPGTPRNRDLACADQPGISGPRSRIGLDGIPSLRARLSVSCPAKAKMPYYWLYGVWPQGASLSVVYGNPWDLEYKFAGASSKASSGTWTSLEGPPCTILSQRSDMLHRESRRSSPLRAARV